MDNTSILSDKQKLFLKTFFQEKNLSSRFYLTGGTALTEFYIPYRYSEDLDFFSETDFELLPIITFLKSNKSVFGHNTIDINTSYNRNIIHLNFPEETLKTEFTYFPFTRIEKVKKMKSTDVDSIIDIAVNKLFTIYQNPRSRDYVDLYMISQKYGFLMSDLLKKAKVKFDWHIDPVKLGSQFLKSKAVKDYPRLIEKVDPAIWQGFFLSEAKKLEINIFK